MGLSWIRPVSSNSSGLEPSNAGSTENNAIGSTGNDQAEDQQPEIIDLTGDDASESGSEIIDLTREEDEDPPEDPIRLRGRHHSRERTRRVRTERNRSRSRSPLRSHERPEREGREREEQPRTSQQVQRESSETEGSGNPFPLSSSERPERRGQEEEEEQPSTSAQAQREMRERDRSRSPLRSPETPVREGMSGPDNENATYVRLSERQIQGAHKVKTRIVEEQDPQSDCSICLMTYESGQRVTALQCSHEFHNQCLLRWMQENPSCPLCRHQVYNRRGRVRLVRLHYITERSPDGTLRTVARGMNLD